MKKEHKALEIFKNKGVIHFAQGRNTHYLVKSTSGETYFVSFDPVKNFLSCTCKFYIFKPYVLCSHRLAVILLKFFNYPSNIFDLKEFLKKSDLNGECEEGIICESVYAGDENGL
jgi:hypothetical protein